MGLIEREDVIKYCKSKAEHYRKRLARIEAQGDAIGYDPTEQIKGFKDEIAIYESFVKELENIPSAEKQGEWIRTFDGNEWFWYCSNCKQQWYEDDLWMGGNEFPHFCPNCGARMKGADDE